MVKTEVKAKVPSASVNNRLGPETSNPKTRKQKPTAAKTEQNPPTEECPICLLLPSPAQVTKLKNCSHTFCENCIIEWAKHSFACPVCRSESSGYINGGVEKSFPERKRKFTENDFFNALLTVTLVEGQTPALIVETPDDVRFFMTNVEARFNRATLQFSLHPLPDN